MSVCACGQLMSRGAGWCQQCHLFWASWWLRYVNDEQGKNTCVCRDCNYRRELQPTADRNDPAIPRNR